MKGSNTQEIQGALLESGHAGQGQWTENMDSIDAEANAQAPGKRMLKIGDKYKSPVTVNSKTMTGSKDRMVMPNFWPADVWLREKKEEIPKG